MKGGKDNFFLGKKITNIFLGTRPPLKRVGNRFSKEFFWFGQYFLGNEGWERRIFFVHKCFGWYTPHKTGHEIHFCSNFKTLKKHISQCLCSFFRFFSLPSVTCDACRQKLASNLRLRQHMKLIHKTTTSLYYLVPIQKTWLKTWTSKTNLWVQLKRNSTL